MIKEEQDRPSCRIPDCDKPAAKVAKKSRLGYSLYAKYCNKHKKHHHNTKFTYRTYKGDECVKCGFTAEHHTQLDVDHIDGNHGNNAPVNLQTLCKNCHSLKTHAPGLFNLDPTAG